MALLQEIITEDKPFGPSASEDAGNELFEQIFDHTNSAYKRLKQQPSLIVGRRGSGKTALLYGLQYETKYVKSIVVPPEKAFSKIIERIDQQLSENTLVETVSDLWINLIWICIFSELIEKYQNKYPVQVETIKSYLHKLGNLCT